MSVETKPQKLWGPWTSGYALHVHTLSSTYVGDNPWGHPMYETMRSAVGELLFKLKYRQDKSAIAPLAQAAAQFCTQTWKIKADVVIPVPPTQTRKLQPVLAVATELGELIDAPLSAGGLKKTKQTPQLKDLTDYEERTEALQDAFEVFPNEVKGKRVLLVDDLYGSGATVQMITAALFKQGGAKAVYLLTLTKKASR